MKKYLNLKLFIWILWGLATWSSVQHNNIYFTALSAMFFGMWTIRYINSI